MAMESVWALVMASHLGKCCLCCCTSTSSFRSIQGSCQIHHESCSPWWSNRPHQERNQGMCHQHHAKVARELEQNDQQSQCLHSCSKPGRPPRNPISSPRRICQACS